MPATNNMPQRTDWKSEIMGTAEIAFLILVFDSV